MPHAGPSAGTAFIAIAFTLAAAFTALSPVAAAQAASPGLAWTGDVHVDEPVLVPEGDTLRVAPGTRVSGDAWVRVEGRLIVDGTAEAPVTWTVNVTLAGKNSPEGADAIITHARFTRERLHESCAVDVHDGHAIVTASTFENWTKAVCVADGAIAEFSGNTFRFNGFPSHATRPALATACEAGECDSAGTAPEGAPGEGDACWRLPRDGWLCRGWGGAFAVGLDAGSRATLRGNVFHANAAGVLVALTEATIANNTFTGNDGGVEVWVPGPIGALQDPVPREFVRITGNTFSAHGDATASPSPAPGVPAGVRVIGGHADAVKPTRDTVRVLVEHNTFKENAIGMHVDGWYPTASVENNTFTGNAIGFRGYSASARLANDAFDNRVWDVYLDGHTGYVVLTGGTVTAEKIHVGGEQVLETDWGLIAAGGALVSFLALVAAATETGRFILLRVLWLPFFTRIARAELLNHSARERIVGIVRAHPGIHLRALVKRLELSYSATVYHVTRLESERLLVSRRDGFHRRFYVPGYLPKHGGTPPATGHPTPRERILSEIHARPGASQSEIAKTLGLSRQLTNHHVNALLDEGRVSVEREGARHRLFPGEAGAGVLPDRA